MTRSPPPAAARRRFPGSRSRCVSTSSSNPTMCLRTLAERSSGGRKWACSRQCAVSAPGRAARRASPSNRENHSRTARHTGAADAAGWRPGASRAGGEGLPVAPPDRVRSAAFRTGGPVRDYGQPMRIGFHHPLACRQFGRGDIVSKTVPRSANQSRGGHPHGPAAQARNRWPRPDRADAGLMRPSSRPCSRTAGQPAPAPRRSAKAAPGLRDHLPDGGFGQAGHGCPVIG